MKTAISVPDEVFERATRRAAELGMSRSELFARAVHDYLNAIDKDRLTAAIDESLDAIGAAGDESSRAASAAGRAFLGRLDDEW